MCKNLDEDSQKRRIDILLLEYGKAQDSAQHHDTLSWTWTTIVAAAVFVLLGIALSALDRRSYFAAGLVSEFGILATILTAVMNASFSRKRKFKYRRCKEIEGELGGIMRQHRSMPPIRGEQKKVLVGLAVSLVMVWSWILSRIVWPHLTVGEKTGMMACSIPVGMALVYWLADRCLGENGWKTQDTAEC